MQYSAALGSRLWGWVGHRHQKKSPTWPKPPTVKLAPLSINRCANDRPLFRVRLFPAVFHPHPPSRARSLPSIVSFSLRPPYVFIISFFLSRFSFLSLLFPDRIGHRPLDVEASMQPSRRWFIANRECVTDFSSLLIAHPRPCFESFLRK